MTSDSEASPASTTRVASESVDFAVQLCRSANYVRRHLERTVLRDARLSWTSFDILQLICSRQTIDTRTIAAAACTSKATVTIVSTELIKRSLIVRHHDSEDARRVILSSTPAAWQLIAAVSDRLDAELADMHLNGYPDAVRVTREALQASATTQ
jgi:DNA-binding MarR family transcriptional regulator